MRRFLQSEAGAVVMWIAAAIVFAAAFTPWLFGWGKDFAAQYAANDGFAGWLGGSCERARFDRYFSRALMFGALLFFLPLWLRVRMIERQRKNPPRKCIGVGWRTGTLHVAAGFAVAAGLLWTLGAALMSGGAFVAAAAEVPANKLFTRAILPALGASLFEEWLFRGILIGLWLRVSGPVMACLGTSLVFTFVHFLEPSGAWELKDPRAWHAGFGFLGLIFADFTDPRFIAAEFLTLFVVGLSLGWARLRTDALWLPIGMHAGWVFAFKTFNLHYMTSSDPGMSPWLVGHSLMTGLLPVVSLLITWAVLFLLLRFLPASPNHKGSSLLSSAVRID